MPMDDDNAARLQSSQQRRQTRDKVGDKLTKFLIRLSDDIDLIDRQKRMEHVRAQIKAHQYMDGNFYGYVDADGKWRAKQKGTDEVWYTDNQIYPYFRTALMELSRTQTEILVNAPDGAGDELVAAAKFAKSRVDANRDRTFNARLMQTRNAYALLNGIVYVYTFMDFGSGRSEKMPRLDKQETGKSTTRLCAICSRPVPDAVDLDDQRRSPQPKCSCGSTYFNEIDIADGPQTVIGYDDVPIGVNTWMVPNPVGVIVSMDASCVAETPFIKWKLPVLRGVLEARYKGLDLTGAEIRSTELNYQRTQSRSVPAQEGEGLATTGMTDQGNDALTPVEFEQHWLDPALYCEKTFDEDMPLGRGKTLKAHVPMGEAYPDGLYYGRAAEMIIDIWNEDKNRKWSSSPYGLRPGSMYGTGSSVALSDQETLNDLEALKMANAWSNGVPREFVDPSKINELSADPTIPTNLKASVNKNIIGEAYAQAPAAELSTEIYALSDRRGSSIQNKIGAMSGAGAGGLADAQKWGDTATAISIKRDLAIGRFSPDLELMADQLDREQATQFLLNEQEFYSPQQWKQIQGDYGDFGLQCFRKCDIRRELIITVSPGSYMPKSDAQTQAKLIQYSELIPVLAQMQSPELIAYAAEVFGIPEHLAGWNSDRMYANKIVRRMESLAQLFVEQYGDLPDPNLEPQTLSAPGPDGQPTEMQVPSIAMKVAQRINEYTGMPVDIFLDNHQAMIDAYRDWRTTDQGREASNALLAAVAYRAQLHQEGIGKQQALLNQSAITANEPIEAKQKEAMAEQASAGADAEETKQQADGIKQLATLADKDDEREHEKTMKLMDHAMNRDLKEQEQPPELPTDTDASVSNTTT
jgi:hypothetical protein